MATGGSFPGAITTKSLTPCARAFGDPVPGGDDRPLPCCAERRRSRLGPRGYGFEPIAALGITTTGRSAMCSSSCETLPSSALTRPRPRAPTTISSALRTRATLAIASTLGEQLIVIGPAEQVRRQVVGVDDEHPSTRPRLPGCVEQRCPRGVGAVIADHDRRCALRRHRTQEMSVRSSLITVRWPSRSTTSILLGVVVAESTAIRSGLSTRW
jgi:hypothetical protein